MSEVVLPDSHRFDHQVTMVSEREINLLARLMHLISSGDLYAALDMVAWKNHHRHLARALAKVFFYYECIPAEDLKAKGYEKLREICKNIAEGLWNCDEQLAANPHYQRMAKEIFYKFGFRAP